MELHKNRAQLKQNNHIIKFWLKLYLIFQKKNILHCLKIWKESSPCERAWLVCSVSSSDHKLNNFLSPSVTCRWASFHCYLIRRNRKWGNVFCNHQCTSTCEINAPLHTQLHKCVLEMKVLRAKQRSRGDLACSCFPSCQVMGQISLSCSFHFSGGNI